MKFITDFIKGIFVGVANVIPGVSGGTMAVSFGVYDKLLSSISGLLKNFKKSFLTLLPIMLGMAFGICAFTFVLPVMLKEQPFITSAAFTGLILGGLPGLLGSLRDAKARDTKVNIALCVIIFLIMFAIAASMPFLKGDKESGMLLAANAKNIAIVPFMGVIAAAAMVIPGVSGSLMLMILGYYFGIITSIKDFLSALKSFDTAVLLDRALILVPFAIGCVLGIFFISKLITFLLKRFPTATYSGILGLVAASPLSVFCKVDQEYSMAGTNTLQLILALVVCAACILVTLFIGSLGKENGEI